VSTESTVLDYYFVVPRIINKGRVVSPPEMEWGGMVKGYFGFSSVVANIANVRNGP
jgi:hypothetical protein